MNDIRFSAIETYQSLLVQCWMSELKAQNALFDAAKVGCLQAKQCSEGEFIELLHLMHCLHVNEYKVS